MTVLFPIITVKEILEYSCLYVLEMRKKNTCKRKKNPNKYMYSSNRDVSHFKDRCTHHFFFHLAPVIESMEIRLTFSCTYHQNNSCTRDYTHKPFPITSLLPCLWNTVYI